MKAGDIDGDGATDLVLDVYDSQTQLRTIRTYKNLGSGGFLSSGVNGLGQNPDAIVMELSDVDSDGLLDLLTVESQGGVVRLRPGRVTPLGFGSSSLEATGLQDPSDAATGDLDGDGDPDLVVADRGANRVLVFDGSGTGLFVPSADFYAGADAPERIGLGDLDLNQGVDIATLAGNVVSTTLNGGETAAEGLLLTEIGLNAMPTYVEFVNASSAAVDLSTITLRWKTASVERVLPLSGNLEPGRVCVVTDSPSQLPTLPSGALAVPILLALPVTQDAFAVALEDDTGAILDEVHVQSAIGSYDAGSFGGVFRGAIPRAADTLGVERFWGQDSNGSGDWTTQPDRSVGGLNRSSGPVATDPLPRADVALSEVWNDPETGLAVEIVNRDQDAVDLTGWRILVSPGQGLPFTEVRPWPQRVALAPGGVAVVTNGFLPAGLPAGVPLATASGPPLPAIAPGSEYAIGLYDGQGRLVDLLRTNRAGTELIHNAPRAPGDWRPGRDVAGQIPGFLGMARAPASSSFQPSPQASLGQLVPATIQYYAWWAGRIDVRIAPSEFVLNCGASRAGAFYSTMLTLGHQGGQGPFLGLGPEALLFWLQTNAAPSWSGVLDDRGCARIVWNSPSGVVADVLFLLQEGGPGGDIIAISKVMEWDI